MEQIKENVAFLLQAVDKYTQGSRIWLLLPICLLLVFIFDKKKRSVFFWLFVIFALTICNPIWVNILVDKFGFSNRYHRFFWMIPFYALVAYCMTRLICAMKHKITKVLMFAVAIGTILWLGDAVFFSEQAPDYEQAVNEYGVTRDVTQLYDILHGDDIENPVVLYDQWCVLNYRQYDPSVISYVGRANILKYGGYTAEQAQKYLDKKNYRNKPLILMAGFLEYQDLVDDYALMNALVEEDISYVVVNKNNWTKRALYDSYEFPCAGETDSYVVYRVVKPEGWMISEYGDPQGSQQIFYTMVNSDGYTIVVDGGVPENTQNVRNKIASLGNHVDAWILTHPHDDHISAFCAIYQDKQGMSIDHIYANKTATPEQCLDKMYWDDMTIYEEFLSLDIEELSYLTTDDMLDLDGLQLHVLSTYDEHILEFSKNLLNDGAMMFKVTNPSRDNSMLFCSDVGKKMSKEIIARYGEELQADYVQMGHHGNGGLSEKFYRIVDPKMAFFDAPEALLNDTTGRFHTIDKLELMEDMGVEIHSFMDTPNSIIL